MHIIKYIVKCCCDASNKFENLMISKNKSKCNLEEYFCHT